MTIQIISFETIVSSVAKWTRPTWPEFDPKFGPLGPNLTQKWIGQQPHLDPGFKCYDPNDSHIFVNTNSLIKTLELFTL